MYFMPKFFETYKIYQKNTITDKVIYIKFENILIIKFDEIRK